jgi:hypothetical protein
LPTGLRPDNVVFPHIALAVATSMALCSATPAALTRSQVSPRVAPESTFRALFNGRDLGGWHGRDHVDPRSIWVLDAAGRARAREQRRPAFEQHWHVEHGELVNDGDGPYATTDDEFGDIELRLEYRTVPKADSGIYLRGNPQVQIWDTTEAGGKWDRGAQFGSGGLFNNAPGAPGRDPLVKADKPFGQWNRLRIIQVGERTWVWLNDERVVDGARMENYWDRVLPLWPRGPIQLQTHGGEIRWRNVRIREIPANEATALLSARDAAGYERVFNGRDWTGWKGPTGQYSIADGTIVCKPDQGGTIYTAREYADFSARLEVKVPPGANNGLAIRYPGEGDTAYVGMCELQVLDNDSPKYATLDPRQYHGSIYGMVAAHRGYLRPAGEWNFQEVTVKGSAIVVELNGTRIVDADVAKVTEFMEAREHPGKDRRSGHFGFAGHNDPVAYRNVFVKEIE